MKNWLAIVAGTVFSLLCLCPTLASAQLLPSTPTCDDPASSMLWRIPGNEGTVYLFGSIHLGRADFYPLHETITNAFESSEHLVFEVDPASAADPAMMLQMQQRGMLPAGQTLGDTVSPEVVAELERILQELGLPSAQFMTMKPWFLTLVLTTFQMTMQGYQPQYGVESYLAGEARVGVEILELESIRQQMDLLEELNAESFLAYTLEGFENSPQEIENLMNAWQCADKDALHEFLFQDFIGDPAAMADMANLREKLFYQRNISMSESIRGYIDNGEGSYFVVVGSGHLLGERSIIDLLRNQGYTVSPVALD